MTAKHPHALTIEINNAASKLAFRAIGLKEKLEACRAERDRLREMLEEHDSYSIDVDTGVSVGRRPGRSWIVYRDGAAAVYDAGRPAEPVRHDLLMDAIASAVWLVDAMKSSDGAVTEDERPRISTEEPETCAD